MNSENTQRERATVHKQNSVDAVMNAAFRKEAGGDDTTSRADNVRLAPIVQLMKDGNKKGFPLEP
jgi:hypothetical protein